MQTEGKINNSAIRNITFCKLWGFKCLWKIVYFIFDLSVSADSKTYVWRLLEICFKISYICTVNNKNNYITFKVNVVADDKGASYRSGKPSVY